MISFESLLGFASEDWSRDDLASYFVDKSEFAFSVFNCSFNFGCYYMIVYLSQIANLFLGASRVRMEVEEKDDADAGQKKDELANACAQAHAALKSGD